MRRTRMAAYGLWLMTLATAGVTAARAADDPLAWVRQVVVIYQENHSFDNLYGLWGQVGDQKVNGVDAADPARALQVDQDGRPFECLLQNDPKLTSPPLEDTCSDTSNGIAFRSAFPNRPFLLDPYVGQDQLTRDLVHRFYQEQYQINGGRQNRYVTGSDAAGLTMAYYDTRWLPVYQWLQRPEAPRYVVLDNFFTAAFGGSFLNHLWLISARTPQLPGAPADLHSVVDGNGMPVGGTDRPYPLYVSPVAGVKDKPLTAACPAPAPGILCGDFVVNTLQPQSQPYHPETHSLRLQVTTPTIGERLSEAGIDWAWYAGGWSNAAGRVGAPGWTNGNAPLAANPGSAKPCPDPNAMPKAAWPNCPGKLFQFHHQPFVYHAAYAEGTRARADHLLDEVEFFAAARAGRLKPVSFVKPIGEENEHPGYATVQQGSRHLVELLEAIVSGPQAQDTLVIVTYDENGGSWDHVPPPGQGATPGPHDAFGPGTRLPALAVSARFARSGVDHTQYDTTSILRTIERRFGLAPVGASYAGMPPRDARVNDVSPAVEVAGLRDRR